MFQTSGERAQARSYEEACAHAATAQGLDVPNRILQQAGFNTEVLQTGGFCMVLQAYKDERVQVWVTLESAGEEPYGDDPGSTPTYLVGVYSVPSQTPDESGTYEGEEELAYASAKAEELVPQVQQYARRDFS